MYNEDKGNDILSTSLPDKFTVYLEGDVFYLLCSTFLG